MMMNMLTVFDPAGSCFFLSNMIFIWLVVFFCWGGVLTVSTQSGGLWVLSSRVIGEALWVQMKQEYGKLVVFFCGLGLMICFSNIVGLFPYVFTSSSHMVCTVSLAMPLWMVVIFDGVMGSDKRLARYVPLGCPGILAPFLVWVEVCSIYVRPLTLSLRLTANMMSGHLLLSLVAGYGSFSSFLGLVLLFVLEVGVSVIQSYVFVLLVSMYIEEI